MRNLTKIKNDIITGIDKTLEDPNRTADDIQTHVNKINSAFTESIENNIYNPRERSWFENILNNIIKFFTAGNMKYEPFKEAETITEKTKKALNELKNSCETPEAQDTYEAPSPMHSSEH